MNQPLPKIETLVNSLKSLEIGEFLKSREYKRFCIEANIEDYWKDSYEYVKNSRTYLSMGMDHEKFDSIDALVLLLNDFYKKYHSSRCNRC